VDNGPMVSLKRGRMPRTDSLRLAKPAKKPPLEFGHFSALRSPHNAGFTQLKKQNQRFVREHF
jgi:hypothetical protein